MFIYYQCNYIQFIHFKQENNNFTMKNPGRHELKRLFTFSLDFPSFLSVFNLLDTFTSSSLLGNHCHQGQYDLHKIKSNGQYSSISSDPSGRYYTNDHSPILKSLLKNITSVPPFSSGSPYTTQAALPYCLCWALSSSPLLNLVMSQGPFFNSLFF